ncbi:MAG TPA: type I 3-dehydroquinate dehydratase, partial [Pyrinomonadaceae bacterium]|nr:type I 3-dehydroquinate dehydratase [Pyrinomonadaceae bacterium]
MPVCVRRANELRATVARAVEVADVIELRLDCLADDAQLGAACAEVARLLCERPRPFILTLRPAEQGGQRTLSPAERFQFWSTSYSYQNEWHYPDFIDRELSDHAYWFWDYIHLSHKYRAICSSHDFVGV